MRIENRRTVDKKVEMFDMSLEKTTGKNEDGSFSIAKSELDMVGVLYAPSIDIKVPIYNRIDEVAISDGAGIMPGTGDLSGGNNQNPILTSHSGTNLKSLFMNLPKFNVKDHFYIKNKEGKTLDFEVFDIEKIHADDENGAVIKPNPNESYISLRTCVPIGVNSHRLYVTGKFVRVLSETETIEEAKTVLAPQEMILLGGGIFFTVLFFATIISDIRREKRRKKRIAEREAES